MSEPDFNEKGPRNLTTGLNLFSLRTPLIRSSSPPMLNIELIIPAPPLRISSYMSQVRTPRASRLFMAVQGSGVRNPVMSSRPSSTIANVYVIGLPFFSLIFTVKGSSGWSLSGIEITGSRCDSGASTIAGITPYILTGLPAADLAYGSTRVMWM